MGVWSNEKRKLWLLGGRHFKDFPQDPHTQQPQKFHDTGLMKVSKIYCFLPKYTFFLDSLMNHHNCGDCVKHNPRIIHEQPQKLKIWTGIYVNFIVGPFYLPQSLDSSFFEVFTEDLQ